MNYIRQNLQTEGAPLNLRHGDLSDTRNLIRIVLETQTEEGRDRKLRVERECEVIRERGAWHTEESRLLRTVRPL